MTGHQSRKKHGPPKEQGQLFSLSDGPADDPGDAPLGIRQTQRDDDLGPLPVFSARPERVGPATVTYVDSKSLLTSAAGFIKSYKFTLNPYSGCGFGCEYCYARFFAPTIEDQNAWGEWVKVKENAVALLQKAQRAKSQERRLEPGDAIYMSSVTDPYQPVEQKLGLTRRILEELVLVQPRLTIQTRSPIATRDIDLYDLERGAQPTSNSM